MNKKPTVSQLLDLLNKPALLNWANKIGLQGIKLDDYKKQYAIKGTSMHSQIYNFHTNKTPFENKEAQKNFESFINGKQIIDMEKNIETDWFIGRYDVKLLMSSDVYICDFKSNSNIYLEQKLQLSAYKMAYTDCKIAVVEIPSFTFKPVDIDFKKCELILKCLSKIYELKQQL